MQASSFRLYKTGSQIAVSAKCTAELSRYFYVCDDSFPGFCDNSQTPGFFPKSVARIMAFVVNQNIKAVSKWERGLSLPDISLRMPLADIFDITATELPEGRRMESAPTENTRQVEDLVKHSACLPHLVSHWHDGLSGLLY